MPKRPRHNKHNHTSLTKMFKGYRVGRRIPILLTKEQIKRLEKQDKLSYRDNLLVEDFRTKCTGENSSETSRARLDALLEKEVFDAKVDTLGNPWERPQPAEPESDGTEVNISSVPTEEVEETKEEEK